MQGSDHNPQHHDRKEKEDKHNNLPAADSEDCLICFDSLSAGNLEQVKCCNKRFHVACLRQQFTSLDTRCPHCTQPITSLEGKAVEAKHQEVAHGFNEIHNNHARFKLIRAVAIEAIMTDNGAIAGNMMKLKLNERDLFVLTVLHTRLENGDLLPTFDAVAAELVHFETNPLAFTTQYENLEPFPIAPPVHRVVAEQPSASVNSDAAPQPEAPPASIFSPGAQRPRPNLPPAPQSRNRNQNRNNRQSARPRSRRQSVANAAAPPAVRPAPSPASVHIIFKAGQPLPTPKQLAEHARLYRRIPNTSKKDWIALARPVLNRLQIAFASKDNDAVLLHFVELLALPGLALVKRRGGAKKLRGSRALNEQIRDVFKNLARQQPADFPSFEPGPREAAADQDSAAVLRAAGEVANGFIGRAAKALCSQPPADQRSLIPELQKLHPQRQVPIPAPPADPAIKHVAADRHFVQYVRKQVATGAAPGPSGWTGELIAATLEDPECLLAWSVITNELQKGSLDARLKPYLLGARLIGIPKPDKSPRPIAVGEAIFKLGAIYTVTSHNDEARKFFGDLQRVAQQGACERMVHTRQAALDNGQAVFAADLNNAFGTINRDCAVQGLNDAEGLAGTTPLAYWAYSEPSPLFVMQEGKVIETILSSTGTRQGCPFGGLLFATGLHPSLKAAAAVNENVSVEAYLDDVDFTGQPADLIKPFLAFEADANKRGLTINSRKSRFFWMRDDPLPEEVTKFLQERGIPIETHAGIILGAPVGRDAARMKELLMDSVKEHDRFFDLLRHEKLNDQDAFLILAKSAVPRMSYLARCVRPEITAEPLAVFDAKIMSVACDRIKINKDHPKSLAARKQLQLPVRLAGFGLRPSASNRHFSWLGAFATSASSITVVPQQLMNSLKQTISEARALLPHDPTARKLIPEYADTAAQFYTNNRASAVKLQKALTASSEQNLFDELKRDPDLSPADLARLNSLAGAWAGWPAIIPFTAALRLTNEFFAILARLRLGYPVFDKMPLACKCGAKFADHPLHGLHCVVFSGQLVSARHNDVLKVLAKFVQLVLGYARIEPRNLFLANQKHPDLEVIIKQLFEYLDVSIRYPKSPIAGAAASAAVAQKEKLYRDLCARVGARFTPFVIESFGAWETEAREFVLRIRDSNNSDVTAMSSHDLFYSLSCEVSIAVQRGNARALLACHQAGLAASEPHFFASLSAAPRVSAQ